MKHFLFLAALLCLPSLALAQTAPAFAVVKQSTYVVGTSAVSLTGTPGAAVPPNGRINSLGQLAGRRSLTVCVSKNASNPASALVTIRLDGTSPTTALSDPGIVLAVGDCVNFPLVDSVVPKAISTQAATQVLVTEGGGTP